MYLPPRPGRSPPGTGISVLQLSQLAYSSASQAVSKDWRVSLISLEDGTRCFSFS
jgi:hypothetical protein